MHPTPVGMRCPECASERTQVRTASSISGTQTAPVTMALIAMNVVAFIAQIATGGGITGGTGTGVGLDGLLYGPFVSDGEWWRVVTSGFLHSGIIHIGFNMFALYFLGTMLEPAIGRTRFILIYAISLVAGSLGSLIMQPDVAAVGASGAVFGLMGAAVVAMRSRGINPFETGIMPLLLLNFALTFTVSGIAVGGHVGGFIGGVVAGLLMVELDENRRLFGKSVVPATLIAIVLLVATFAAAVIIAPEPTTLITF